MVFCLLIQNDIILLDTFTVKLLLRKKRMKEYLKLISVFKVKITSVVLQVCNSHTKEVMVEKGEEKGGNMVSWYMVCFRVILFVD